MNDSTADSAACQRKFRPRALLAEIDAQPLPGVDQFREGPMATDVEWFFTANELCSLISKSTGSDAFRINPGLAKPEQMEVGQIQRWL